MSADNRAEIVLDGNISPLRQKLREAAASLNQFGDQGAAAAARLSGPLASLQSKFVAIAATLSGLAMGSSIKAALDQADALNEMSERTGLAVDALARLKFAGQQTGVELSAIGDSVKKLGKLLVDAGSGDDDVSRRLRAFGVSLEQIKRADAEGALRSIAETVASLPQAARQGALENLAKGFGDLVPLLKDGAAGLDQLFRKADQLKVTDGYVAAAAGADEFNDSIARLQATMTGVTQRIAADFLPGLTGAVEGFGQLALAAEENKSAFVTLGTVVLGGLLTNALRSLTVGLAQSAAGWLTNLQATRQATVAKVAATTAAASSTLAIKAHCAMLVAEAEAAVASANGMARLALVQNTLIPARRQLAAATEVATAAERALAVAKTEAAAKATLTGAALTAMGGPLGAIVTLIGLGTTAWAVFGQKGVAAVRTVTQEIELGREALERFRREQKYGTGDEGQLRASLEAVESRIAVLVQSSGKSAAAAAKLAEMRKEAEALGAALDEIAAGKQKGIVGAGDTALQKLLAGLGKPAKPDDKKDASEASHMGTYEAVLANTRNHYEAVNALRQFDKAQELKYWEELRSTYTLTSKDATAIEKRTADLTRDIRRAAAVDRREKALVDIDILRAKNLHEVALAEQAAQHAEANGSMTKLALIAQEEEFARRRLEVERQAQEARIALFTDDPSQNEAAKAALNERLLEIDRQYQLRRKELQQEAAMESREIWRSLTDTISGLWDKGITAIMNGTFTWRNAFRAIGAEMVSWFATDVVGKKVKKWIAGEAEMLAVKMGFLTAEKTAQTVASNVIAGEKGKEAIAVVGANAAEAGSGAAAAVAPTPWVGPVLALAAMAAVFAAVSGIGRKSAARGYDIPKGLNPLVQTHEEEMILPQKYANVIRGLAAGGATEAAAGAGGDVHIYARNDDDVVRVGDMKKLLREMGRNFVNVKR